MISMIHKLSQERKFYSPNKGRELTWSLFLFNV